MLRLGGAIVAWVLRWEDGCSYAASVGGLREVRGHNNILLTNIGMTVTCCVSCQGGRQRWHGTFCAFQCDGSCGCQVVSC